MPLVFCIYSVGFIFNPKGNCVKWPHRNVVTELMAKFPPGMDSPHPQPISSSRSQNRIYTSLRLACNMNCFCVVIRLRQISREVFIIANELSLSCFPTHICSN